MTAAVTPPVVRAAIAELRALARQRPDWPYLVPVPTCEPPFDDERTPADRLAAVRSHRAGRAPRVGSVPPAGTAGPAGGATGSVATAVQPRLTLPARPVGARSGPLPAQRTATDPVRTGRVSAQVPGWCDDPDMGIRRTSSSSLPPAERAAAVLARGLVEVLAGIRAPGQLRAHCSPSVFAGLEELPVIPGTTLPKVRSVRVSGPADGVAEVCVVYQRGQRVRALAFRLDGVDGRWRMTALQVA